MRGIGGAEAGSRPTGSVGGQLAVVSAAVDGWRYSNKLPFQLFSISVFQLFPILLFRSEAVFSVSAFPPFPLRALCDLCGSNSFPEFFGARLKQLESPSDLLRFLRLA